MANASNETETETEQCKQDPVARNAVNLSLFLVVFLGICLNLLAARRVHCCGSLAPKVRWYYLVLVLTDLLVVLANYFVNLLLILAVRLLCLPAWLLENRQYCKFRSYFLFALQLFFQCFLLLICLEQCVGVWRPSLLKRWDLKTWRISTALLVIISLIAPLWTYLVEPQLSAVLICVPNLATPDGYWSFMVYLTLDALLLPSVIIVVTIATLSNVSKGKLFRLLQPGDNDQLVTSWSQPTQLADSQKREASSVLYLLLFSALHSLLYVLAGVAWMLYAVAAHFQWLATWSDTCQLLIALLCEVSAVACAALHCFRPLLVLLRTADNRRTLMQLLCSSSSS